MGSARQVGRVFVCLVLACAAYGARAEEPVVARATAVARPSAEQKRLDRISTLLRPYFAVFDSRYLQLSGGTMTGPLVLRHDPVSAQDAATKAYVDNAVAASVSSINTDGKVNRSGDTMSGPLTLNADPTGPLDAATKQYVDRFVMNQSSGGGPGWGLSGNAGTTGQNFLGTTDAQGLEIRVNNQTGWRIGPVDGTDAAPNIIGGSKYNSIASGAQSCIIAGGGFSLNPNKIDTLSGAAIGGGESNSVSGNYGTVAGGFLNSAKHYAAVAGGLNNNATGFYAAIPGGQNNVAKGASSLAAGAQALANNDGEFVWADSTAKPFPSGSDTLFTPAANDFLVRATGGVVLVSGVDASGNATSGVKIAPGSGSWTTLSDRTTKANFRAADVQEILNKVATLPIETWNYKSQADGIRHIGPMSQDFHAAFGLGEDEHGIPVVDGQGVALAAIQALHQQLAQKQQELDALKSQNQAIEQRLAKLEAAVSVK